MLESAQIYRERERAFFAFGNTTSASGGDEAA